MGWFLFWIALAALAVAAGSERHREDVPRAEVDRYWCYGANSDAKYDGAPPCATETYTNRQARTSAWRD